MKITHSGASRHRSTSPRFGAGSFHRRGAQRAEPGILSTIELRRLVAQMVD